MKFIKAVIILLIILSVVVPVAFAQDGSSENRILPKPETGGGTGETRSKSDQTPESFPLISPITGTLSGLIENIIVWLLTIAIPIATIMIIVGAYQMLVAAGDPQKFQTGKKTITYAVVGLIIVLLARGLIAIVTNILIGR